MSLRLKSTRFLRPPTMCGSEIREVLAVSVEADGVEVETDRGQRQN